MKKSFFRENAQLEFFLESVGVDKDGVDQDIKVIKLERSKLNHQVRMLFITKMTQWARIGKFQIIKYDHNLNLYIRIQNS